MDTRKALKYQEKSTPRPNREPCSKKVYIFVPCFASGRRRNFLEKSAGNGLISVQTLCYNTNRQRFKQPSGNVYISGRLFFLPPGTPRRGGEKRHLVYRNYVIVPRSPGRGRDRRRPLRGRLSTNFGGIFAICHCKAARGAL